MDCFEPSISFTFPFCDSTDDNNGFFGDNSLNPSADWDDSCQLPFCSFSTPFCDNDCLCASNKESPRLCASTGTTADVFPLKEGSIIRDERGVSSSTDAYSGLISLPSPLISSSLEAKSATNPIDLFSFEPLSASFTAPGDESIAFPEKKRKKVKFLCTIVRQQRSSYRCGEMTAQRLRRGLQARGLSFIHDSRVH